MPAVFVPDNAPSYLPNDPVLIEEYAKHYDAIQITDQRVGEIIKGLKENKVLNNTINMYTNIEKISLEESSAIDALDLDDIYKKELNDAKD